MRCEQARQLFDAYLDGELSPALATELGAHRLRCAECRRALALLEVSGHILASDRDPVSLPEGFEDRLLACMAKPSTRWSRRARHALYIAGPLAAAALVALAFLGAFDRRSGEVAGEEAAWTKAAFTEDRASGSDDSLDAAVDEADEEATREWDLWGQQVLENFDSQRQRGESLQRALDQRMLQFLDVLEKAKENSRSPAESLENDVTDGSLPPKAPPTNGESLEDR